MMARISRWKTGMDNKGIHGERRNEQERVVSKGGASRAYRLLRPLLFALDPERSHWLALNGLNLLARGPMVRILAGSVPDAPCEIMGLRFPNRVGLAAGLDKNAEHVDALATLGFGFLEVGTVTPRAQLGNPQPRLFRLPRAQALINRMGFNNQGLMALLEHLSSARFRGVLGINIGKNRDTDIAHAAEDYLTCMRAVYAKASYITVNVSSPNTPDLRTLQFGSALDRLLESLKREQQRLAESHGRYVPLAVKIAPDLAPGEPAALARAFMRHQVDAVIATNTTSSRVGVEGEQYADEPGGLSGRPLTRSATRIVSELSQTLQGAIPIIAAGGIMSAADARERIAAGASLLQIYTGLIYRGPALVREIGEALADTRR